MAAESGGYAAVVGLGCVLPDAFSVEAFWMNTLAGHCALHELTGRGVDWRNYCDPSGRDPDRSVTILGALIDGWQFDWRRFRMPPADAELINPLALMILDAGAQALDGLAHLPADRTGLFIGATGLGWQRDAALRIRMDEFLDGIDCALAEMPASLRTTISHDVRQRLDARLGPVTEDTVVNGPASTAAGRLAMHYDLRGLHYAIDAGYASGLAALDVGMRALREGTVDAAVVGGASELLNPLELVAFSRLGRLSRDSLRPFDAGATGTLLGEGVALFVLKRLEDAIRDGERIYAVVRGVGGASDGRGCSLLTPLPDGQARAIRRAYDAAGVDPRTIRYVECHASGIPADDRSELTALRQILGSCEGVMIGSGKASVGHLRGGAGAVGLLRAVLALSHRVVPCQLGFTTPSDVLAQAGLTVPLENTRLTPRGDAPVPRAAVNAFGIGGIGYHAVLEAYDPDVHQRQPCRLRPAPSQEPIAIVGMGGVFPGATDVPSFWRELLAGTDTTREVPPERWDVGRYHHSDPSRSEKSYTKLGCFLDRFVEPEPEWRIPPSALDSLDPSHLLCLKAAEEALADAGIDLSDEEARERVAVMLAFLPYQGKKFLADVRVNLREVLAELERSLADAGLAEDEIASISRAAECRLKAGLPPINEESLTGWLGSLNAGRIAQHFDLHGPHFVVDAACASTHGAVHAAVQALRSHQADLVLTGGVWCDMQPEFFVGACRFNALSASGSKPFDASADGFIPGEGGGVLVLRRLADAIRDGQRVHAVIRSVAGSSDGQGRSVLAPTVEGEALAMQRALEEARLCAADIGYVECHGTGTALGDQVEVTAVGQVYGQGRHEPLRIGSVKSNIGHLNAAAGVPGLIKAAIAVRDGDIPASLNVQNPNPRIDISAGQVEVVRERTTWERPPSGVRRAGVSSFGVGGANMHVIIEEFRGAGDVGSSVRDVDEPLRDPLPIARAAGASPMECFQALETLARRFAKGGAETLVAPIGAGPWRAAIVSRDADEFSRHLGLLRVALDRGDDLHYLRAQGMFVARTGAPVVVTFPGQGPHYVNMARELAAVVPEVREALSDADEEYQRLTGRSLLASFWTDQPENWQQADEDIHCAVYAVNLALYRMLERRGFTPVALIGQSAGEISALVAGGSLSFADGLRAVHERTRAVLDLETDDPGTMVSIRAGAEAVVPLLDGLPGYAALAADNGPAACIVSANGAALEPLLARLTAHAFDASVLAVSHGYHSQLIAGAMPAYRRALEELHFSPSRIPIISTITGRSLASLAPSELPNHLTQQFVEPVWLRAAFDEAWRAGGRLFVECGPKWSLTTFASAILEGREHWGQAMLHPKVGECEQAARALACLWVHTGDRHTDATVSYRPLDVAPARQATPPEPREAPLQEAMAGVAQLAAVSRQSDGPTREQLFDVLRRIRDLCNEVLEHGTAPAATAPASLGVVTDQPDVRGIEQRLVAAFAARTGYPEEMLEVELDLEADLGIDTVKQMAVVGELRTELGLEQDQNFALRDHPTIAALTTYLAARVSPVSVGQLDLSLSSFLEAEEASIQDEETDIMARLRTKFAQRTGYPEEMLEAGLDLEADLGIDTVKQVAVVGELRQELQLEQDPEFVLRDHASLGRLATYLTGRLALATRSAAEAPQRERPTVARGLSDAAEPYRNGAREQSSPAGSEAAAAQPHVPRAPVDPLVASGSVVVGSESPGTHLVTIAGLLELALSTSNLEGKNLVCGPLRLEVPALVANAESLKLRRQVDDEGDRSIQITSDPRSVHLSLAFSSDDGRSLARLAPELAQLFAGSRGSGNGAALTRLLGRPLTASQAWAHAPDFETVVGWARFADGEASPQRSAGLLCDTAVWYAELLWSALLGVPHRVCGVSRLRLDDPAIEGEVRFVARLAPRAGGRARADVRLYDASGRPLGLLAGVEGVPLVDSAGRTPWRSWRSLDQLLTETRDEEGASHEPS